MKRFQLFSLASAMLLASTAGFTSCSSDSEDPQAGGSGVAGQVVKTQFYLNIPYAGNDEGGNARVSTRMKEHYTQNDKSFLGLSNMQMFSFDGTPGTGTDGKSTSTAALDLGTSGNASSKDNISGTNATSWRSVYRDIAIPVGTKNIILYAKAPRILYDAAGYSTDRNNFQAGYLSNPYETATGATALSSLNFNLETIYKNPNFAEDGKAILTALNDIANTSIEVVEEGNKKTIKWSEIKKDSPSDLGTENEREALASRYTEFIKLTAGSANSVIQLITDLKNVIGGKNESTENELAKAIVTNCNTALNTTLKTVTFPRKQNLPDGVAKVKWENGEFAFVEANSVGIGTANTSNNIDYTKITYPAELAYFVSSPVKTSQDEITASKDLPSYADWLKDATWAGYKDVVENRTRFVALQKPLQYGVACLESSIKCNSNSLEDNAANFDYDKANSIPVPTEGLKVTGILVGGQPQGVGWNFEPNATSTNDFKYTIYDNDMNYSFTAKSTDTNPNYTLVLDNKDVSSTKQSKVFITVELENNTKEAFYGAEDIIPTGSKFYLVGELDPNNTATTTQPSTGETIDHVFIKDHTTVANFTIKDLKKAYNHIPDMRTTKINVGLAVDLSWQKGITFDVEL